MIAKIWTVLPKRWSATVYVFFTSARGLNFRTVVFAILLSLWASGSSLAQMHPFVKHQQLLLKEFHQEGASTQNVDTPRVASSDTIVLSSHLLPLNERIGIQYLSAFAGYALYALLRSSESRSDLNSDDALYKVPAYGCGGAFVGSFTSKWILSGIKPGSASLIGLAGEVLCAIGTIWIGAKYLVRQHPTEAFLFSSLVNSAAALCPVPAWRDSANAVPYELFNSKH